MFCPLNNKFKGPITHLLGRTVNEPSILHRLDEDLRQIEAEIRRNGQVVSPANRLPHLNGDIVRLGIFVCQTIYIVHIRQERLP